MNVHGHTIWSSGASARNRPWVDLRRPDSSLSDGRAARGGEAVFTKIVFTFITSVTLRERVTLGATFARAALVYWAFVFPRVCVLIRAWRRRAQLIPDPELRRLALVALGEKRANIEGACAFAAFAPRAGRAQVTRALAAFQAAYNYLDMLGEQPSADPVADGRRLHEGLLYALAPPREGHPGAAPLDWYEHHPRRNDGGYLRGLLEQCRHALACLPSYDIAAPAALAAAERIVSFQSLNLSESQGDHGELERWATEATPPGSGLDWWETAASAGSSLGVYALIAAAAGPRLDEREVALLRDAYFPWIGALHSLLDNLIDKHEDEAAGHRSLLVHYAPLDAARRLSLLAERALSEARALPHGERHVTILAAMVANYLSSPQAHGPELEPASAAVLASTGPLVTPALIVFKLRRLGWTLSDRVSA